MSQVVDPGKTAMTNAEVLQWVGKTQEKYHDANRTMPSNFKYIIGAVGPTQALLQTSTL